MAGRAMQSTITFRCAAHRVGALSPAPAAPLGRQPHQPVIIVEAGAAEW
jgi:hypothetical protein